MKTRARNVRVGDVCGFGSTVVVISHAMGNPWLDVLLEKKNGDRFWTTWKANTSMTVRRPDTQEPPS